MAHHNARSVKEPGLKVAFIREMWEKLLRESSQRRRDYLLGIEECSVRYDFGVLQSSLWWPPAVITALVRLSKEDTAVLETTRLYLEF